MKDNSTITRDKTKFLLYLYKLPVALCIQWVGYVSLTKLISFSFGDRRAIRRNESVKYVVQDSVLDYIIENKLYNPNYSPGETDSR